MLFNSTWEANLDTTQCSSDDSIATTSKYPKCRSYGNRWWWQVVESSTKTHGKGGWLNFLTRKCHASSAYIFAFCIAPLLVTFNLSLLSSYSGLFQMFAEEVWSYDMSCIMTPCMLYTNICHLVFKACQECSSGGGHHWRFQCPRPHLSRWRKKPPKVRLIWWSDEF